MRWTLGESDQAKQVATVMKITANLYEQTIGPPLAPSTLRPTRPDSRFRYVIFCLTTVHVVAARHMKKPKAVMDECVHRVVRGALSYEGPDGLFDEPVSQQDAASVALACVNEFLGHWSEYLENLRAQKPRICTSLVATMLRKVEFSQPENQNDNARLSRFALTIEAQFENIDRAFAELVNRNRSPDPSLAPLDRLESWLKTTYRFQGAVARRLGMGVAVAAILGLVWWNYSRTENDCPSYLATEFNPLETIQWNDGTVRASIYRLRLECLAIQVGKLTKYEIAITAGVVPSGNDSPKVNILEAPLAFEAVSESGVVLATSEAVFRVFQGQDAVDVSAKITGLSNELVRLVTTVRARWPR
jgi:hypothetical protein